MRRIVIIAKGLNPQEIAAARAMAVAAGCDPNEIEVVESVGEPALDCDDEIIVFMMTPPVQADPEFEAGLKKAQNGGRRAICVWPEDAEGDAKPPVAAAHYAYSIVPWDAEKFSAVAADDDALCFETPAGETLPKVPMKHNLCVEDDKKAKTK